MRDHRFCHFSVVGTCLDVNFLRNKQQMHTGRGRDLLASEASPRRVRYLLFDQGHEVELRIEFVGFRPGVREKSLLVQLLRYL